MRSLNASVSRSPGAILQLATSQALLIWLFHVLGSPFGYVKLFAALAGAVLLPVLVLPSVASWLGGRSGWLQRYCARRSFRTAQVPQPNQMPVAVQAILQLAMTTCDVDWSGGIGVDPTAPANRAAPSAATWAGTGGPPAGTPAAAPAIAALYPRSARPPASSTAAVPPPTADKSRSLAPAALAAAVVAAAGTSSAAARGPTHGYGPLPRPLPFTKSTGTHTPPAAAAAATATAAALIGAALRKPAPPKPIKAPAPPRMVGGGSLKAPVGLSRCTIAEDAPFPPPNTQVVMELTERTLRVGGRRLRYRGYRPADRTLPLPAPVPLGPEAADRPPPQQQQQQPSAAVWDASAQSSLAALARLPGAAAAVPPAGALGAAHLLSRPSRRAHAYAHHHHLQQQSQQHQPVHPHQPMGGHHRLSLSIKVPWGYPSALPVGAAGGGASAGGGLLESLNEALASGSGYMVVGAAVRPGCILVQLDLMATSGGGGSCEQLLRGMEMATVAEAATAGGGGGGGSLAAQLARHVGVVAPPPPDSGGGEVTIRVGGRLSYSLSYDAPTGEWSGNGTALGWIDDGPATSGRGGGDETGTQVQTLLRRLLYGPNGVTLRPDRTAVVVPAAMITSPDSGDAAAAPSPPMLHLTLQLEVADAAAAAMLVEQLRPLLLAAPSAPLLPPPPRHGASEGWHLVANCLGRSLPVFLLRVVAPSRDGAGGAGAGGASAEDAAAEGDGEAECGGDGGGGGGGGGGGSATLSLELCVLGSREALEAVSCRLAVLSVEVWYGIQEVAQAPVMLVHETVAAPPDKYGAMLLPTPPAPRQPPATDAHPAAGAVAAKTAEAGGSDGGDEDGVARAVAAELCWLAASAAAAAAAEDGSPEDEQCVRQMLADLGTLELYVASQVRRRSGYAAAATAGATTNVVHGELGGVAGDGGVDGDVDGDGPAASSPSPAPLSWSTDGLYEEQLVASDEEDVVPDPPVTAVAAPPGPPPPPPPLLSGSVDVSPQLQRLLARDDTLQRQAMLLTGANLLSYAVLHAMPHTANAVRQALAALGCGLAEADELSATAAGGSENESGTLAAEGLAGPGNNNKDPWVGGGVGPCDGDGGDVGGLPLMHLAVLSGDISVVQVMLRWAAVEGLGPEWLLRRHRGRSPLQLAAAAAANGDGGTDGSGGVGGVHVSYLAEIKRLLEPLGQREDDMPSDQAAAAAAPPHLWRAASQGGACNTASGSGLGGKIATFSEEDDVGSDAADCKAVRAARGGAAAGGGGGGGGLLFSTDPFRRDVGRHRRHPILVGLLGYADAAVEARYRRFVQPYDAHVASYWVPLMCILLASALLRPLRGAASGGGGNGSDWSETPMALFFAWPYVVMAAGLMLRPRWVHSHLPAWWLLCGAARLSIKWPLCALGLLPPPASLLAFVRSGVSLVSTALLPGLCERVPGLPGLALRLLDAAAHFQFLLSIGLVSSRSVAALHAMLRVGLFLAAGMAVERHYRARFERALVSGRGG